MRAKVWTLQVLWLDYAFWFVGKVHSPQDENKNIEVRLPPKTCMYNNDSRNIFMFLNRHLVMFLTNVAFLYKYDDS